MTSRLLALFACGIALAVACGSDDDKVTTPPDDAGGAPADAGAPPVSAAGSSMTSGGSGGGGGSGGDASAGDASLGGAMAGQGAAGAPGAAGTPDVPSGPVSACGAQMYETGDGCAACPSPPSESPTTLSCQSYSAANKEELTLTLALAQAPLHEPQSGEASITWQGTTGPGQAVVPWTYSTAAAQFVFDLPLDARYAEEIHLVSWTFTDSCGYAFSGSGLYLQSDGQSAWVCVVPT